MTVPTTFATLKTAVQAMAVRSNTAFTDLDDDFVRYAQDEMNSDPLFRFREMEQVADLVLEKSVTASTVGGTANAITLTRPTSDTVTAYTLGQRDKFTAGSTNTDVVTVNIDGVGATALRKGDGSANFGPLEANDIVSGHDYYIYYDGTVFRLLPAASAVPLPSRYLGTRQLFLDVSPRQVINIVPPDVFHARVGVNNTDKPKIATVEGEYLILSPRIADSYSLRMLYWRGLAAFSADGDTDWALVKYPNLYLFKTLSVAFTQLQQTATAAIWEARYEEARDNLRKAQRSERFGAAPLKRSRVNAY